VTVESRADGSAILRSPEPLRPFARAIGEWLVHWAAAAPDRTFLAERTGDGWRRMTYRVALAAVRRIGGSLLARGLTPSTPVAVLSGNSVNHALLALGAMHVGIPYAPISPAYSLQSRDHAKLRAIYDLLQPGLVYVDDPKRFAPALDAIRPYTTSIAALLDDHGARADEAFATIGPNTIAKILFTSGSTGAPKGVINTQRMLCSNQQSWAQAWPFLEDAPPVLCEWLPWNHTFGGNGTFNLVLRNGGTLYIDDGKPTPDLIAATARNLREVSPTLYFNVPRGYDLLLPLLESDEALRRSFFASLDAMFYAGAALPQNLYDRLHALIPAERTGRTLMLSGWGSTETAPLATIVHFPIDRPANVGNPAPGIELKLLPSGSKLEVRVKGPNVTPGYFRHDDFTRAAFDEEGFYKIGDAMRLFDPEDAAKGLVFDGRVAEDFKLQSGTWVNAGAVRVRLIAACNPLVQDAVITGHDRTEIGALVWLNPAVTHNLAEAEVYTRLQAALASLHGDSSGSSTTPSRLIVLKHPPSIDEGEITDKGYINQRAVLESRAAHVDRLHAGHADVIVPE
jgi:feruloyl-CoA synthase